VGAVSEEYVTPVCTYAMQTVVLITHQQLSTMTVEFNFDKAKQQQILMLFEWLKKVGLVNSYKIQPYTPVEEEDPEGFITDMVQEAEQDLKNGNYYSSEEAKKMIGNWLKESR